MMITEVYTDRLRLRPFRESDFAPWYACVGDPETARLMGGDHPENEAQARELFSLVLKPECGFLAICPREGEEYLGHLCVSEPYPPVQALTAITGRRGVSVSYAVAREHRRQHIALEAVSGLIRRLFRDGDCDYVNCGYLEYNAASAALQKKLGFLELCSHFQTVEGRRVRVMENILYRRENM